MQVIIGSNTIIIPNTIGCIIQLEERDIHHMASSWIKELSLSYLDQRILKEGRPLTANHMHGANLLLKKSFPEHNGLCDTSYLSERLEWKSVPRSFVQIIHVNGNHWACLTNKFCHSESDVELYDSLHTDPANDSILEQAAAILKSTYCKEMCIKVINVQTQKGVSECGAFAIAMAYDLCNHLDPFQRAYDQSKLRLNIEKVFVRRSFCGIFFSKPQRSNSKLLPERIVKALNVELHCVCRLPELLESRYGDMACCDACKNWFHADCLAIPVEIFSDPTMQWFCTNCVKD